MTDGLLGEGGGFLQQLEPGGYVMDLRPDPAPGATPDPPTTSTAEDPVPAVVALSRIRDPELGEVTRLLRKAGIPCVRVDADRLARSDLLIDPARRMARLDGCWLIPTVLWCRHFSVRAINDPAGPVRTRFAQESWDAAAEALAAISAMTIRSTRPGLISQLRLAARHGIEVPRTLVTTDPAQVVDLLSSHRVIVKAAHQHFVEAEPGRLTGVFPVVRRRSRLSAASEPGPPVIVQEYVEHQVELRVYYVHGRLHGFRVSKQAPADPWMNGDRVAAAPVKLGPAVAAAARTVAEALGFRCAALDFLLRDGSPVFLEADPSGDWRWIELKAGTSAVSEAVAAMLGDLHRARLPPGGTGGKDAFSLLNFLAG